MATTQSKPAPVPHPDLKLPPPQLFDILPPLHELLSRIDHNTTSLLDQPPTSDSDTATLYTDLPPLQPKDLPTEVLQIKARIRRALRELEKLPDMERSVAEQEEEMRELEERIRRQEGMQSVLAGLAGEVRGTVGQAQ